MRFKILCSSLALVTLAAIPATGAKTVVEFTDGRYLEVRAHEVLENWVRLEIRRGSTMVIPAQRIEMIERDDREVYRQRAVTAIATAGQDSSSDRRTPGALPVNRNRSSELLGSTFGIGLDQEDVERVVAHDR